MSRIVSVRNSSLLALGLCAALPFAAQSQSPPAQSPPAAKPPLMAQRLRRPCLTLSQAPGKAPA